MWNSHLYNQSGNLTSSILLYHSDVMYKWLRDFPFCFCRYLFSKKFIEKKYHDAHRFTIHQPRIEVSNPPPLPLSPRITISVSPGSQSLESLGILLSVCVSGLNLSINKEENLVPRIMLIFVVLFRYTSLVYEYWMQQTVQIKTVFKLCKIW